MKGRGSKKRMAVMKRKRASLKRVRRSTNKKGGRSKKKTKKINLKRKKIIMVAQEKDPLPRSDTLLEKGKMLKRLGALKGPLWGK